MEYYSTLRMTEIIIIIKALRTRIDPLIEKIMTFDNSFDAIGQKKMAVNRIQAEGGRKQTFWPKKGIKHEWEPNLHLVPIPLVSYRSR